MRHPSPTCRSLSFSCMFSYANWSFLSCRCAAHNETKDFACKTCGWPFAIMADLRAHMTHHQEVTFKCDTCGHQMNRKDQYDDHMAMHLWAKNHECKFGKTYTHKPNLYRHQKFCKHDKKGNTNAVASNNTPSA